VYAMCYVVMQITKEIPLLFLTRQYSEFILLEETEIVIYLGRLMTLIKNYWSSIVLFISAR